MRVIAGLYRGRKLASPPREIRPTGDRLRESLFNHLGETVQGSRWVDLFAGSGAVAIEALSRGASHVLANDSSRAAVRLIERNLRKCGIESGIEVHQLDAFTFLRRPPAFEADFVFLDPPYAFERYRQLLEKIEASGHLAPNGVVLLEVFKKTPLNFLAGWRLLRTLKAGDSHLLVLKEGN